MRREQAIQLMQDTMDSMWRSEMLKENISVTSSTVLLGSGSKLDSLGFVTFISDLEERISDAAKSEIYLVLTEIHNFNTDNAFLSVEVLAEYIENITQ